MAGDDHAGVTAGAAITIGRAAIDDRNGVTALRGVVRDTQADDPPADHEDGFAAVFHRELGLIPQRKGSAGFISRVASLVI